MFMQMFQLNFFFQIVAVILAKQPEAVRNNLKRINAVITHTHRHTHIVVVVVARDCKYCVSGLNSQ